MFFWPDTMTLTNFYWCILVTKTYESEPDQSSRLKILNVSYLFKNVFFKALTAVSSDVTLDHITSQFFLN